MNDERFDVLAKNYIQEFPACCGFEVMRVDGGIFECSLRIPSGYTLASGSSPGK